MSRSFKPTVQVPHGGFPLLRDLVHERTGLYFDDNKRDIFFDKLSPLIGERAFDSFLDYYFLLKNASDSSTELKKVFDALTIQESYFWREMEQVHALVNEIVPRFFKANPYHTLNIWSAACAGGEEPLSIAMALEESGWFGRGKIELHASDACPRAIESAKGGAYRERSFRSLSAELREKYFARLEKDDGGMSRVSGEMHSKIHWRLANLMSEDDLAMAPLHSPVIFCRNVFIYFSQSSARKTVQVFADRMPAAGCLFVGAADLMMKVTSDFELQEIGDAFAYVRI